MNKHKQLHFIAVLLLAFALSLPLVPVCHAQSDGSSGSDVIEGGGDSSGDLGGSGSDQGGSGETDSDSPATGSTTTGLSVFQAAGPNPVPPDTEQSIQSTVDAFRAALGDNNLNFPGPLSSGRREINWDGGGNVDTTTAPVTPFNGFLDTRGAQFTTPGQGLSQAPPAGGPQGGLAELFSNPSYGFIFSTFSPLRLFTPVGSNITEALFFIPGTNGGTPALVRGFGSVFTDVDNQSRTRRTIIEYYDANNQLLFRGIVPASPGTANISFFGVLFDNPIIARVRIRTGNSAPGPDDDGNDIVMMDDFIYGEPQLPPP